MTLPLSVACLSLALLTQGVQVKAPGPQKYYYDNTGIFAVGYLKGASETSKRTRKQIHESNASAKAIYDILLKNEFDPDICHAAIYRCHQRGMAKQLAELLDPGKWIPDLDSRKREDIETKRAVAYLYCLSTSLPPSGNGDFGVMSALDQIQSHFQKDDRLSALAYVAYNQMNMLAEARTLAEKVLKEDPKFYQMRLALAISYMGGILERVDGGKRVEVPKILRRDFDYALKQARIVIQQAPNWTAAQYYVASIAFGKDKPLAKQCLKKLIAQIKPSHPWYAPAVESLRMLEKSSGSS